MNHVWAEDRMGMEKSHTMLALKTIKKKLG
jgi:hypothetical protein